MRLAENARKARQLLQTSLCHTPLPVSGRDLSVSSRDRRRFSMAQDGCRFLCYGARFFFLQQCWAFVRGLSRHTRDDVVAAVVRLGGPAQVRFLLAVAELDANGDGEIDDLEWDAHESNGESMLAGIKTLSDTTSVICALMLGLTHLLTIGRPISFQLSELTENAFGPLISKALLWTAYSTNVASEASALVTLIACFTTRYFILMVLPTLESKIEWVQRTRPIVIQTQGYSMCIWCFTLSIVFGALVASPDFGFLAVGIVIALAWLASAMHAHMYRQAALLLVDEVQLFIGQSPAQVRYVEDVLSRPSHVGGTVARLSSPADKQEGTSNS